MRLFVGAEVPAVLRDRLGRLQAIWRECGDQVRWTRPEGIHLTLKFLGEVDPGRIAAITAALRAACAAIAPFSVEAGDAVAFPARGAPRLLWVEVRGDIESARRLAGAIDAALSRLGFAAETRPYTPHLTLGRLKDGQRRWRPLPDAAEARGGERFEVADCVLFESRTGAGGSLYTALERFPLAARVAGAAS